MKTVQKTLKQLVIGSNPIGVTTSSGVITPTPLFNSSDEKRCVICDTPAPQFARVDWKTCRPACRKALSRGGLKHEKPTPNVTSKQRGKDVTLGAATYPGTHVNQDEGVTRSPSLNLMSIEALKRDMISGANLRLLDLFCGCGGASVGYAMAGFHVTGVDIENQQYYPFDFIQGDALKLDYDFLMSFDVITASPPCQAYSRASYTARKKYGIVYPDLYQPVKRMLVASGKPYVIENVVGSPAKGVRLFGDMFGLGVLRERIFESNLDLTCDLPRRKVGSVKTGEYVTVAGSGKRRLWPDAMGIQWADTKGIRQAIPPAFTEYLGKQIYDQLEIGVTLEAATHA